MKNAKKFVAAACIAMCAALAASAESFRGRESWACIKAYPAVVNPVVPAGADGDILSLRG